MVVSVLSANRDFTFLRYPTKRNFWAIIFNSVFLGHLAKAVDLKDPAGSSEDIGDGHTETPLPATLVRIPAEPQEKTNE